MLQRMRAYELVLVLSPEADEKQVASLVERVAKFITDRGGTVSEQQGWGVRRLAYPIRRFQEGNYLLTRFLLDAKDLLDLERTLKTSEDVMRHLVTKANKLATPATAVANKPATPAGAEANKPATPAGAVANNPATPASTERVESG